MEQTWNEQIGAFESPLKPAGDRWFRRGARWLCLDPAGLTRPDALAQFVRADMAARMRGETRLMPPQPPAGLRRYPYQDQGIARVCECAGGAILADEMGLGKTIQAIGVADMRRAKRVLVVCPATLRILWEREFRKWQVHNRSVSVAAGAKASLSYDVCVISYSIAPALAVKMYAVQWDLLIFDEAHYLKTPSAKRTRALMSDKLAGFRLYMTGTPVLNRPIELYTMLRSLEPMAWSRKLEFAKRFCGACCVTIGNKSRPKAKYWDMGGASNREELRNILLSRYMIRRTKADVFSEMPPVTEQIIPVEPDRHVRHLLKAFESKVTEAFADQTAKLSGGYHLADHVSIVRRELGEAKIAPACAIADDLLEGGCGKLVIFAHHRAVIEALAEHFGMRAVIVYGGVSQATRQERIDSFQTSQQVEVFIGQIQAAGVGLTLTAASDILFVEQDWVPSNMAQAIARCHRIGQERAVSVRHVVVDDSLDARICRAIVDKMKTISDIVGDSASMTDILKEATNGTPV